MSALTVEDVERIVDQRLKALFEYTLKGFNPVGAGAASSSVKPSQTAATTPNPPQQQNPLWEQMQSTSKGPWERTRDLSNAATQEIINQLTTHNGFYQDDGYKYWLLTDQEDSEKIKGVGRRAK